MFRVCVSTSFDATHALTIQGIDETPHSHNWKIVATLEGTTLDNDELLIDFLEVERILDSIIAPFKTANLNTVDVLEGKNPSTELVALYIGEALCKQIQDPIQVQSVAVTEAPNCKAIYYP